MQIKCKCCGGKFKLNEIQKRLILRLEAKEMNFGLLDCPLCHRSFQYGKTSTKNDTSEHYSCPICDDSIVIYIHDDDEKFWGCGDCGNVWEKKEDFLKNQ